MMVQLLLLPLQALRDYIVLLCCQVLIIWNSSFHHYINLQHNISDDMVPILLPTPMYHHYQPKQDVKYLMHFLVMLVLMRDL